MRFIVLFVNFTTPPSGRAGATPWKKPHPCALSVNLTFPARLRASRWIRHVNVRLRVRFVNFASASANHALTPTSSHVVRFTVSRVNFTFPEPFRLFQQSGLSDAQSRVRFVNFASRQGVRYNSRSATQSRLIPIDVRPQSDAQFSPRHHHPGAIPCQS